MNTRKLELLLAVALTFLITAVGVMAATEEEKEQAILAGLANLFAGQQVDGSWDYGVYDPAATGAAVTAFVSQNDKWGANDASYQTAVDAAVEYLLGAATKTTVSTRNDGVNICPGGIGDCPAVYWDAANNEDTYTTGLIIPALMTYAAGKPGDVATASGPLADMTWGEIAQANTNLWAASQATALQGNRQGGWRYALGIPGYDADMSTTQWGIISLLYNETMGATTPDIVKTDLALWLAVTQDPVSGAGCYQPGSAICDHSDTGGLLLGLKFIGTDLADAAVQNALGFLNNNWTQTAYSTWYGNFGHPYAMWSVYKGLEVNIGLDDTTYITNLLSDCGAPDNLPGNPPGSKPCNWWEDYDEYLVNTQNADGGWTGYSYWYGPLATSFYVNILGATAIPIGPDCSEAYPSVSMLWPPNHKFVEIEILGVTHPAGDEITITIQSIFQDEPVTAQGTGTTAPDGRGVGTSIAEVRSERMGSDGKNTQAGNGRVYHIEFLAEDPQGASCSGEVLVGVPHDQNPVPEPIDDGAIYDSTEEF
jgi:hypothetical protein